MTGQKPPSTQAGSETAGPHIMRVLNAGSGVSAAKKLHPIFRTAQWQEVCLDIDPAVKPDLVGTIVDMTTIVPDANFDALWSSHNIEHLHAHEVPKAFREFRRVLKGTGFALLTCPDLEAIAQLITEVHIGEAVYQSPAGPITPLDMIYGHGRSIEQGNSFMAHKTGFTNERLGRLLIEAGFSEVRVIKGDMFDLWAIAMLAECEFSRILKLLSESGLDFLDHNSPGDAWRAVQT